MKYLLLFLNLGLLILACIGAMYLNYRTGGIEMVKEGFTTPKIGAWAFFKNTLFIIVALSVISGQISTFYSKRPEKVRAMIAGKRGMFRAVAIGAIIPGGTSFGHVIQKEWNGQGNKYSILAFIASMMLFNWLPTIFRIPFFGLKLSLIIATWSAGLGILVLGVLSLLSRLSQIRT